MDVGLNHCESDGSHLEYLQRPPLLLDLGFYECGMGRGGLAQEDLFAIGFDGDLLRPGNLGSLGMALKYPDRKRKES